MGVVDGLQDGQKLAVDSKASPSFGRPIRKELLDKIAGKEPDHRIFIPIARHSPKWERACDRRTSVERVNSRIDRVLCFELHTIRGMKKRKLRVTLALVLMLAMALCRIRIGQMEKLRSMTAPVNRAA